MVQVTNFKPSDEVTGDLPQISYVTGVQVTYLKLCDKCAGDHRVGVVWARNPLGLIEE